MLSYEEMKKVTRNEVKKFLKHSSESIIVYFYIQSYLYILFHNQILIKVIFQYILKIYYFNVIYQLRNKIFHTIFKIVRQLFAKSKQSRKSMRKTPKNKHYDQIYIDGLQGKKVDLEKEVTKQKVVVRMSEMTEYMMEQLVNKYQNDFKAMELDYKLNPLQYTAKKLEYYYNQYINLGKEIEKECKQIIPTQDDKPQPQKVQIKSESLQKMKRVQQLQKQFQ